DRALAGEAEARCWRPRRTAPCLDGADIVATRRRAAAALGAALPRGGHSLLRAARRATGRRVVPCRHARSRATARFHGGRRGPRARRRFPRARAVSSAPRAAVRRTPPT